MRRYQRPRHNFPIALGCGCFAGMLVCGILAFGTLCATLGMIKTNNAEPTTTESQDADAPADSQEDEHHTEIKIINGKKVYHVHGYTRKDGTVVKPYNRK